MRKETITPNYERMRESYCYWLQTAWVNYCRAVNEYLTSILFDENGQICMLYTDKLKEKMDEAEAAFNRAGKDLHDFDIWVAMEKRMKGETKMKTKTKPCKRKKCPYYYVYSENCRSCDWNPDCVWTERRK